MLNRRHIRTLVIQSVYSNSIELIDSKSLKAFISKSSSTSIDLLYCVIDLIKEINIHFNNLESKNTASCINGILNCKPGLVTTFLGSPN